MLWRAADHEVTFLESTGLLLGYEENATYDQHCIDLEQGDDIFLGTDGLYEVHCHGRYLEMDGLLELYIESKLAGDGSAAQIVSRVADFCDHQLRDDIAVLRVSVLEWARPTTQCNPTLFPAA